MMRLSKRMVVAGVIAARCVACTSSSSSGSSCPAPGGAVAGPADSHCTTASAFVPSACHVDASASDAGPAIPNYGPPMYGSEGDDDECKYHMTWTSTPVCQGNDVSFTVTVVTKSDMKTPVTGADVNVEAFLTEIHPASLADQKTVENPPGTYTIGPVRFDTGGKWTLRYHLFQGCDDGPQSPHGHAAFYLQVP